MGHCRDTPLLTLIRLREEVVARRKRALAEAVADLTQARQEVAKAQETVQEAEAQHRAARLAATEGKAGPAGQLQAHQRFIARRAEETGAARQTLRTAEQRQADCGQGASAARAALARAQAELDVVVKAKETWDEARRREAEARAEQELEELSEAWRSRSGS